MTYEEISTLLFQIEAVLYSRPLLYIDNEHEDSLDILSPSQFLVGRLLTDIPEHVEEVVGSLNRWKLLEKTKKGFWNMWKDEYLSTLQQRRKWVHPHENLKEGDFVIIKDELSPPARYPLGKVHEIHPGKDMKIRVLTLKMQNGYMKRPIQKLCPLVKVNEKFSMRDKEKRMNFCLATLVKVFLMLLIIPSILAKNLNEDGDDIASVNKSAAIYLDRYGSINMVSSSWTILVYF